ncbi:ABC transporter ATP-binding protein [Candidatus Hecatella orcuttiae]|jgi:spermidine/putrescine transport system ATP-binding protein|uniref:ABC transporter ATP-binding protein n=1 Tax=Candidatus Hecatella orcuttiae TaxID=1935119 RepID=UPI002867C98F|nr:ABC transporter ATP-binding protein [Candidatus Hecatella orcuttiae]
MKIDVELKNVTKKFGDVVAVSDVSFQVEKGQFFSLLGPSGCGKTTILRMISGFEKPTEGEILIEGEPMADVPPFKRPTNLVFQSLALFPHLNVYENIAFGLKIKKIPENEIKARVKEMLDLVRLPGYEKRKISQLSGGEKQRIAIVRALVNKPTVLLLDEPLGPLDLKLREEMIVELKRIKREVGTTFIYVTHDQGEALTMSDKIAVMKAGKIMQIGSPIEIYEQPNSEFVANFIGGTNVFKGRYENGAVEVDNLGKITVTPECQLSKGSVLVSIKPEKIFIGRKLNALDNIFAGEVKEAYYQGRVVTYRVLLENGSSISVVAPSPGMEGIFGIGEKVKIGWNKKDSKLIT